MARKDIFPGNAPKVPTEEVVGVAEVVETATTVANQGTCPVTAPSQDRAAVAAAAAVETATTADNLVIFPGIARSQDREAVAVVAVAVIAITCSVTVAVDTATCRVIALNKGDGIPA